MSISFLVILFLSTDWTIFFLSTFVLPFHVQLLFPVHFLPCLIIPFSWLNFTVFFPFFSTLLAFASYFHFIAKNSFSNLFISCLRTCLILFGFLRWNPWTLTKSGWKLSFLKSQFLISVLEQWLKREFFTPPLKKTAHAQWAMSIHCKKAIPKIRNNIPRKGISRQQSQFPHSCVCERFIYFQDRSTFHIPGAA